MVDELWTFDPELPRRPWRESARELWADVWGLAWSWRPRREHAVFMGAVCLVGLVLAATVAILAAILVVILRGFGVLP